MTKAFRRPTRKELLDKSEYFRSELAKLLLRACAGEQVDGQRIIELDDAVADKTQVYVDREVEVSPQRLAKLGQMAKSDTLSGLLENLGRINMRKFRQLDALIYNAERFGV
jgi:predicted transcriptional regulator